MLQYLKVGQIINTHGVKGEFKVFPLTDNLKRFSKLKFLYIKSGNEYKKFDVNGVKYSGELVILKLNGIEDMNAAIEYKKQYIYVDRENAVKLPEDSYFIADLVGLDVFTEEGQLLGSVSSVFSTGSNDVYEIKREDESTFLIPAIKDVIKNIDLENNKMIITLLEGLI